VRYTYDAQVDQACERVDIYGGGGGGGGTGARDTKSVLGLPHSDTRDVTVSGPLCTTHI
jgi:hypothetical protein